MKAIIVKRLGSYAIYPKQEKIIIEMASGYYKDDFIVACSQRRRGDKVIKFIV